MKKIQPIHIVCVILFLVSLALLNTMMKSGTTEDVQEEPKTPYVEIDKAEPVDEGAYKQSQVEHSKQLGQILDGVMNLNQELSENPGLIQDSYFVSRVEQKGEQMEILVADLENLPKPSSQFVETDKLYRQAVAAYREGIQYYVQGVKENDLDLMVLSGDKIQIGSSLLNEAVYQLEGGN